MICPKPSRTPNPNLQSKPKLQICSFFLQNLTTRFTEISNSTHYYPSCSLFTHPFCLSRNTQFQFPPIPIPIKNLTFIRIFHHHYKLLLSTFFLIIGSYFRSSLPSSRVSWIRENKLEFWGYIFLIICQSSYFFWAKTPLAFSS